MYVYFLYAKKKNYLLAFKTDAKQEIYFLLSHKIGVCLHAFHSSTICVPAGRN